MVELHIKHLFECVGVIYCVGYQRKPEYDTAIMNKPDKEAGNGLHSRENSCMNDTGMIDISRHA